MTYNELGNYYQLLTYIESLLITVGSDREHLARLYKIKELVFDCFSGSPSDFWTNEEPINDIFFYSESWDDFNNSVSV